MATVRASLYDNSVRDDTDDDVNGSEVDANPNYIADVIDGTITSVGQNQVGNAFLTITPWNRDHRGGRVMVYNNSSVTIADNALLYVSGYDTTNSAYRVSKAQSKNPGASSIYATLVADGAISPSSTGKACTRKASLSSVNTNGLTVGRPVYLASTAGGWSGTMPAAQWGIQIVGWVAIAAASGTIIFEPGQIIPWTVADQI